MNLGEQKMAWAWAHLPVLRKAAEDVRAQGSFAGKRIAICLHLEAKTACLAWALHEAGAQVYVTGSNPLSTQDDVAEALRARGVQVFGFHGVDESGYHEALLALADAHPQLLIDDGGDLVHLLHEERVQQVPEVIGGCEETTTGILRLLARQAAQALRFPMMAVNDAKMKRLFDNRYGTGQSAWDGVLRTTNLTIAGSTVVVAGYGFVGRGIAERARGLGARVIVCEVDPVAALEAVMEGFLVMPMVEAASLGDFFITATGMRDVIDEEVLLQLKEGAVLANAGHFNVEIDTQALQ
ncbi:MAG: adenosylhomocysteinase, partial [Firmicutes bacterium]|nr:adenosylhomocysteinase [Bacillota bacterium]